MPLYQQWQLVLVDLVADLLRGMEELRSEWWSQTGLELASVELLNLDGKGDGEGENTERVWGQYKSEGVRHCFLDF